MTAPVAGIDYNMRHLDVAIVNGKDLLYTHVYDLGRDLSAQVNVMAGVVEVLRIRGVKVIVMEKPWMREGRGMGTAMELHKVPLRVETIAVFAGLQVRYVPVNTWHLNVLGNGGLKTDAAKEASRRYVRMVYGQTIPSADTCDAVCLATYGGQLLAREERLAV